MANLVLGYYLLVFFLDAQAHMKDGNEIKFATNLIIKVMSNKQTEVNQVISEIREILRNLTPEQYERLKNSNVGLPTKKL